jgi:hypothetical protein
MNATALAAPIVPGKLEEWKEFSRDLHEGPRHSDFAAFVKKAGLSRVRCWLQEGPGGAMSLILYEGEMPAGFLQQIATSQEPFAVWFRERIKECNGMDLTKPAGPPPELVTDVHAA